MTGWQNFPFKIEVKKGEKIAFCACGLSKKGPRCDGTHAKENSELGPGVITFDEDKTIFACGCKKSNKMPLCDGAHKNIKIG